MGRENYKIEPVDWPKGMISTASILSNRIKYQNRALLWALLIALTILLLLYPVRLTNEYYPIQAPYLFDNLWLFGALFCVWVLLFLLLLFSIHDNARINVEGVALASIFGLGFIGFWIAIGPFGGSADAVYNMAHVEYLMEFGRIPIGNTVLAYFDFPGMHILVATINQICGFDIFNGSTTFLLFNAMLFAVLLYIFCLRLLKNNIFAFLSIVMIIMGSAMIVDNIRIFYPRSLGFTYIVAILMLVSSNGGQTFNRLLAEKIAVLIICFASVISYFPAALIITLVFLGIYIIQWICDRHEHAVSISTIFLLSVIILGWEMFWTWHTFQKLVSFLPKLSQDLFSGGFLMTALTMFSSSASGRLPFWALGIQYFWLALLAVGTILGLLKLAKIKKLTTSEILEVGGLLGIILLATLGLFGTERGSQFARYLMYAPIFCMPVLIEFLLKRGAYIKKRAVFLAVPLVIFGLPSFLVSVNTISTDVLHNYEYTAGNVLYDIGGEQGRELCIYCTTSSSVAMVYYNPRSSLSFVGINLKTLYGTDQDAIWQEISGLVDNFQNSDKMQRVQKIFIVNEKTLSDIQHITGCSDDPAWWENMKNKLSICDRVYANGHVTYYIPNK